MITGVFQETRLLCLVERSYWSKALHTDWECVTTCWRDKRSSIIFPTSRLQLRVQLGHVLIDIPALLKDAQWEVFSSCLFSLPFVFLVTTVLHRCAEKYLSDARIFFSLTAWQQLKLSVIVSKILYLYCSAFLLIASNLLACVVKAFRISPILFTQWLANLSTFTFNFPL